jgi:hypothetical protein
MDDDIQITEKELDAIYKYLSISFDDMNEEEQKMWTLLLSLCDPEFDDDEDGETT